MQTACEPFRADFRLPMSSFEILLLQFICICTVLVIIGRPITKSRRVSYFTEPLLQRMSCSHLDPILAPEVARAIDHPKLELTAWHVHHLV